MLNSPDVFSDSLIKELVGAGLHRYTPLLCWERLCSHSSLYLVSKGELTFELEGRTLTAAAGQTVFLRAGEWALIKNSSETDAELYYLAFRAEEEMLTEIRTVSHLPECAPLFREAVEAYLSREPLCGLKIAAKLYTLLGFLLSAAMNADGERSSLYRIRKAAEYVTLHIYESITVADLAKEVGYSEAHLRRLFCKLLGTTPKAYILDRKLERATALLRAPEYRSVEEISDLLAFCSPSYFCHAYKKKYGHSPMKLKSGAEGE